MEHTQSRIESCALRDLLLYIFKGHTLCNLRSHTLGEDLFRSEYRYDSSVCSCWFLCHHGYVIRDCSHLPMFFSSNAERLTKVNKFRGTQICLLCSCSGTTGVFMGMPHPSQQLLYKHDAF